MRLIVTDNAAFEKLLSTLFPVPRSGLDSLEEQLGVFECKNTKTPIMLGVNPAMRKAVLFHPRCKLWKCPECAQINKELWTWRASSGGRELATIYGHIDFLTLTSHEKLLPTSSIDVWPDAWDKLRGRLRRASDDYEYFAVPERHKSGKLHVHAIIATSADLPKRWWKNAARASGMGYMADLQEVLHEGGVGGYVGKYLAKTLQYSNWKKGFRRVRTSQGWPKLPPLPEAEGWNFVTLPDTRGEADATIRTLESIGYDVALTGHKTAWELVGGNWLE